MTNSKKTVAVVGASKNRSKYGNKAVRAYLAEGWEVYPVHPEAEEIEGIRCYRSVKDIPVPLDRVAMYVPPEVGLRLLPEIAEKHPGELWLNPGSESPELVERATALGLQPIQGCAILGLGRRPAEFSDV